MSDTDAQTLAKIERLEKKIASQGRTIESLMDTLEARQAGTEATQFQTWAQNVRLEEVLKRKTESLEQGLKENQELNLSLQGSQHFLNSVIDTIPAKICILDENGVVIKINHEWQRREHPGEQSPEVGVVLEDFLRGFLVASNASEALPNGVSAVVKRKADSYSEHTKVLDRNYQTNVAPIPATPYTLVQHHDITELIDAQVALDDERRQNQLLSLVARHTGSGILIMDFAGNVEWNNRAYESLIGFSSDGLNGFELVSRLVRDPAQIHQLHENLSNQNEFHMDVDIHVSDGSVRHMDVEFRKTDAIDGEHKLILVAIDITERVAAKQALANERQIFENVISNVPHGVYWKNRNGQYLGCNDAYATQLGLPGREVVIGKTDDELALPVEKQQSQARHEQTVFDTGASVLGVEEKCVTDSKTTHMLTSRVALRDEHGDVSGVLGIFADITSVKAMEDQLNQARRLEAIGQLSAGIAHEINTPMQYIGDNIQFLERASELLIQMGTEVEKLSESHEDEDLRVMFGNWLRVSRFGQLKSRVPTAIVSAKEGVVVVSQIVQAMKAFAHPGDRELKLADLNAAISNTIIVSRNEWKYVADIDTEFAEFCAVKCNLGELNQVFLNIIVNAAHAISDTLGDGRRMGRIKISTHDEPNHVEVRIRDDGSGMPDHIRARIFEQFFTTKAVGSGTGQGLALAHAVVVDRHKGAIDVDSAPGKGTIFRIRIPKVIEDAEAA